MLVQSLLYNFGERYEQKFLFRISFPIFVRQLIEKLTFDSLATLILVKDLKDCIPIWSSDGKFFEALAVGLDSTAHHSFERSSPALLCYLIVSAFTGDYSCDYITKRYRQADKDENPLCYLALILFCCGLFCFSVTDSS